MKSGCRKFARLSISGLFAWLVSQVSWLHGVGLFVLLLLVKSLLLLFVVFGLLTTFGCICGHLQNDFATLEAPPTPPVTPPVTPPFELAAWPDLRLGRYHLLVPTIKNTQACTNCSGLLLHKVLSVKMKLVKAMHTSGWSCWSEKQLGVGFIGFSGRFRFRS